MKRLIEQGVWKNLIKEKIVVLEEGLKLLSQCKIAVFCKNIQIMLKHCLSLETPDYSFLRDKLWLKNECSGFYYRGIIRS